MSYNREILLDCDAHVNVDWCGSAYIPIYLYKYIYKGSKIEKMRLQNADDIDDQDEINLYLRARMLCSMEAMWRVFGYQTYPVSSPSVTCFKVKLPSTQVVHTQDEKLTDLFVYFNRPNNIDVTEFQLPNGEKNMDDLLYMEFFKLYRYNKYLPRRYVNKQNLKNKEWWFVEFPNGKRAYIFRRNKPDNNIPRMHMLYPTMGEIWYVRLLLLNFPSRGYSDLLSVD